MPCVHPIPATRSAPGERMMLSGFRDVRSLGDSVGDAVLAVAPFLLPCGSCVGCQITRAREWAIRCTFEESMTPISSFVTLTFADKYVPPTLRRSDLSLFVRYMRRKVGPFRFFGCGEYGEDRGRPHYHAILFGTADYDAAVSSWRKGFVTMDRVTPERISYTAGYCAKKLGFKAESGERIDYSTGEIYKFQKEFLQMSRRPGIGGDFRKHWRSWRKSAIWQGREFPVPRFLHASYKENASESDLAALELEKLESRMTPTIRELNASESIVESRMRLRSARSKL